MKNEALILSSVIKRLIKDCHISPEYVLKLYGEECDKEDKIRTAMDALNTRMNQFLTLADKQLDKPTEDSEPG